MAKSRRIFSALLAVLMVLTLVPAGLFSTAGAVSPDEISTSSIDVDRGILQMPNITISSTAVIRTAAAAKSQANGTTIVKATASGLPEISGDYTTAFYAGETPTDPMVVFTTDKALKSRPTVTCTNATLTFTAAQSGAFTDGVYTYSWRVSGSNVTAKQLNFEVGYTYEYTDANGKTVTKVYTAYTTSAVETIAQPGGIYASRYRSWNLSKHACDRKEKVSYIARILGANTFGTYYDAATSNWTRGYFDFNTSEFVSVDGVASGYGQLNYDDHSADGTQYANTGVDNNRPMTVAYVDRSMASLNNYNLRFSITDVLRRTDKYSKYGLKNFKVLEGAATFDGNTADSPTSKTQLGIVAPADTEIATVAGGTITIPMNGANYGANSTDLDNGNKSMMYTFYAIFGDEYNHVTNLGSAINFNLITYDKSELRAVVQDLTKAYAPTTIYAADSEIGNNPNSWYYSEGWSVYLAALKNAEYILNDPDTDQKKIDAASAALTSAVAGLKVATADYTEADVVKNQIKSLQSSIYTDATWSKVQTAVANIKDGISVFYQTYLDSLVADLRAAINALELNPADYTEVETMIEIYEGLNPDHYTAESWKVLRDTVNSVDYTLKVDRQALVDSFARSIDAAITNLVLAPANYDEINALLPRYEEALKEKDYYTDLSWRAVNAAYNALEFNKTWKEQDEVDDMAINLRRALNNLKYKDADYTALENAIDAAGAEKQSWYTPDSWAVFAEAYDAAVGIYEATPVYNIKRQGEVDAATEALKTAQEGLIPADGDYTEVYNAMDAANDLDESKYTPDSWQALQDTLNNVEYNLTAKDQTRIDGFAKAINDAIKNLKENGADYTEVHNIINEWNAMDKSRYTDDSVLAVVNTVNNVNWALPASAQTTVDGYVTAIRSAMNNLKYKPADYTAVNAAVAKANEAIARHNTFISNHNGHLYYTEASFNALVASLNYTKDLDIRYQSTVDGYAAAINNAFNGLRLNVADYTAVEEAIKKIPADFEEDVYTDETAAEVIAAKLAVTEGLLTDNQGTVDSYAKDIEDAVKALRYKPADYTQVENEKKLIPADLTPYTSNSVYNLNQVLNSVNYGLNIKQQATVDGYAAAIKAAREALEIDKADYTIVENAIRAAREAIKDTNYTNASIQAVVDAIDAVVYDLPSSQQSVVNGYAAAIDDAVNHLTDKPLYTSRYENVAAKAPESLDMYTDESVKAYNDASAAAENYKLEHNSIRNQDTFDALVDALEAAINGLSYKKADYTAVNDAKTAADAKVATGNYTDESVAGYNALIAEINWDLNVDKQTTVDGYAASINAYVFELKAADYSVLDKAVEDVQAEIAKNLYTDASVAGFNAMVAGFDRGLKITDQSVVDGYIAQVNAYTFEYLPADYTALDALVAEVNAIDPALYTNYDEIYYTYILQYVMGVIPSNRGYNITEQSKVDEMKDTLQSYVDMLVLKDTKVAKFELKNGAKFKTTGGVTYIIGLRAGLTDASLKSGYFVTENVTVTIKRAQGRNVGTGSTVTVKSALDGSVIGEYVILLYGDINGDGAINTIDSTVLSNVVAKKTSLNAAQKLAANINGDRKIDATDKTLLKNVSRKTATIDQITGKAVRG